MKAARLFLIGSTGLISSTISMSAQDEFPSVYISPSGAFRIEMSDNGNEATLISTADRSQKTKIPMPGAGSEDANPDDEFYFSPNDEWIFAGRHVGSCLRAADLYHHVEAKIDVVKGFNDDAWKNAARLHATKDDYWGGGACGMTFFGCWSSDSKRLLLGLLGGEDRRDNSPGTHGYLYFNIATQKFEVTDYLQKLNATKSQILACAEPIDPLPPETELKMRAEALDKQLNDVYSSKLKKMTKDRVSNLRESQRNWMKARDTGLQLYLRFAPAAERERRRLQFLRDVTLARIESLGTGPSDEEPFDFWERISER